MSIQISHSAHFGRAEGRGPVSRSRIVFAWLLFHGSGNPAAISRDTGYFFKSVQLTLNEMEESCQILSSRQGRAKIYRAIADSWRFLLAPHGSPRNQRVFPVWFAWMPVFAILTRIAETFAMPVIEQKPEAFQAIKFRDALDSLKPAIDRVAVCHDWHTTTDLRSANLMQSLLADLDSLLG